MKNIKEIARRITASGEKDVEAMKQLCRAAGMENDLEKFPDDQEWLWEVAWNAAEKLGVDIDEPNSHFYDRFRVDMLSHDTYALLDVQKNYGRPVFDSDDYWEAKKHFLLLSQKGCTVRIVGLVNQEPFPQTASEEVLTTNDPSKTFTDLDDYWNALSAEKSLLLRRVSEIDRILVQTYHPEQ